MMKTLICLSLLLAAVYAQDDNKDSTDPNSNQETTSEPDVRVPPSIVAGPPKYILFRNDEVIHLPCIATGTPKPSYQWYKDGEVLNVNLPQIELDQGNLTISEAGSFDGGYYQCFAINQHGKSMSGMAYLQRAVLGTYQPPEKPTEYYVNEGDPLKVNCEFIKSVPLPKYTWALGNSMDDNNPTSLRFTDRLQADEKGNLYFAHTRISDAQEGKLYKCNVFNSIMDFTTGGSYSTLIVNPATDVGDKKPVIKYPTADQGEIIALVGEELKVKCLFGGKPTPSINWSKVKGSIPNDRKKIDHFDTELTIVDIRKSDEGDYKCQANNNAGQDKAILSVSVQSRPTFITRPRNTNQTEGRNQVFRCDAKSEPASSIQWYINGDALDHDSPGDRRKVSKDDKELTIENLCKDCSDGNTDLMVVQCNASNVHGYAFADGYLNVLLPTTMVVPLDTIYLKDDEEEADFPCEATSDDSTDIVYTWFFNGKEIDFTNVHYTLLPVNTLHVDLKDLSLDEKAKYDGMYTCNAFNGYSNANSEGALDVPGVAGPLKAGVFEMWWIFLIIAIVLLLLILLLCCCLCIQRNKGDTYPVDQKERANGNDPEKELVDSGFHDYQRPEDGPIKGSRASLSSTIKLDSDDEGSLNEYGDIDAGKFNEDGSFIGQYSTDKKRRPQDSTV